MANKSMQEAFQDAYQRDWNDPAGDDMKAIWEVAWKASQQSSASPDSARLVANFLRQIAGTDWSKNDLAELADAVETGARKVTLDLDY